MKTATNSQVSAHIWDFFRGGAVGYRYVHTQRSAMNPLPMARRMQENVGISTQRGKLKNKFTVNRIVISAESEDLMKPARVVIADDHAVVRMGLVALLIQQLG
jgi:hypothetical protein